MEPHEIRVSANGDTVWITAFDGSCIGRFSKRFGIDVHRTVTDQMNGAPQCLYCTHIRAEQREWRIFRLVIGMIHGIEVPPYLINFP